MSFSVNFFRRYIYKGIEELRKCLKRVLVYSKGSTATKLKYKHDNFKNISIGYVESD